MPHDHEQWTAFIIMWLSFFSIILGVISVARRERRLKKHMQPRNPIKYRKPV